jgi:hypothetical protein
MFKAEILNELNNRSFGGEFVSEQDRQDYLDKQIAKESFGKAARAIKTSELPAELSTRVESTEMRITQEAQPEQTVAELDENGNPTGNNIVIPAVPEVTEEFSLVKADYVITLSDISAEVAKQALEETVRRAIDFGIQLLVEFASENIALGITADGKTSDVRKAMSEVTSALTTGSLHDAIAEARLIQEADKDDKYITNERLLEYINKIETYLGLPLSSQL